jgi:FkbM family methyltransferase
MAIIDRLRCCSLSRRISRFTKIRGKVRYLFALLLWRSRLCRFFIIRHAKFNLRFHPSSLSAAYWHDINVRRGDEQVISACLRPGDVFIDVGSNIGSLTLAGALAVGPKGRVISLEPHPRIFKYLVDNVSMNKFENISAFNVAIGEAASFLKFTDSLLDDQNSVSGTGRVQVEVKQLDVLVDASTYPRLIKIDTEGYEVQVLLGAQEVLKRTALVYCEVNPQGLAQNHSSIEELITLLLKAGLAPYTRSSLPAAWTPIALPWSPPSTCNILAIRGGHEALDELTSLSNPN